MKLLIYPAVDAARLAAIAAAAPGATIVNAATEAEALEAVAVAVALFGRLTPPMLARAARLKWVQSPTASLEHYIFPELAAHSLTLTNMRGLFSDIIADQVMGYIIMFARNLHIYMRQQVVRKYSPLGGEDGRSPFLSGPGLVSEIDRQHRHLAGSTVGIIGLGGIGQEVASRARAFGMNVIAVDPRNPEAWPVERCPELLRTADYSVICAPHTPRTEGMFDSALLAHMNPNGYLINIGRGAILKLDALVAALGAGKFRGAALDVYEVEPLPADHPLWDLDNVILTPHIAGYATVIADRHLAVFLDNLARFLAGATLNNVVEKAEWH